MNSENKIDFALCAQDSLLIKGLAICLMLWHHLFYRHPEYGFFIVSSAFLARVCVPMFLWVSAYGLTLKFESGEPSGARRPIAFFPLLEFYLKRFSKLYLNFWPVFLLSVPAGVFIFKRSVSIPYGSDDVISGLLLDFFGLQGFNSYNVTWWFYQLIIAMYLLFPLIFIAVKKQPVPALACFYALTLFHRITIPVVHDYLFAFALGTAWALYHKAVSSFFGRLDSRAAFIGSLILSALSLVIKKKTGVFVPTDLFLWVAVVLLAINVREIGYINTLLRYLGRHSMNIFMVHTFICYYFYADFVYSLKHPALMFFFLLFSSLAVSEALEFIKRSIGIHSLQKKISGLKLV
jgi:hypothetical protein